MVKRRLAILSLLCLSLLLGACSPPAPIPQEPTEQPVAPATATATAASSPSPTEAEPTPEARQVTPEAPASDYLRLRTAHATALTSHNPAPYDWHYAPPPPGVREVRYPSEGRELRAWLALPANAPARVPAVVYFHGYFGLGWDEFEHVQPFLDAGYAVLLPALRGENGNPGDFELWYGEIDDAQAAVQWLAGQPEIDATRIYAFGWSVGGGVSTLLSLWADVPVRLTASCGGLYTIDVFDAWSDIVPFDRNDAQEKQLRLLRGNMASMQHRHIAYAGQEEWLATLVPAVEAEAQASNAPLTIQLLPGDHYTALPLAMAAFIEEMEADR